MDFTTITAIFGHNLFGGITINDFRMILKKISDHTAENHGEADDHSNPIKLMSATFSILTGDQRKASQLLEEISEKPNMRWKSRADLYRILQLTTIMYPPLMNATNCVPMNEKVLVEKADASIVEVRRLKAEIEIRGQAQTRIDRLEESTILRYWDVRSSGGDHAIDSHVESLLAISETSSSGNEDIDPVYQALVKIRAMEQHHSPEALNPLTLNLLLISSNKPNLATEEDKNEPRHPALDCSSLMDVYNECARSFKAAKAHRAYAGACQRSGAVALIFSLLDPSLARAVVDEAEASFQASCDVYLADGDVLSHRLARIHLLLAHSLLGRPHDYRDEGYQIGIWAKETQNTFLGNAIGLMAARFGWQRWLRYHASAAAARSLQIALGIFSALKCYAFRAQVIFTLGDISVAANDFHGARSRYLESLVIFTQKVFTKSQKYRSSPEMEVAESEVLVNMSGETLQCFFRLHDQ